MSNKKKFGLAVVLVITACVLVVVSFLVFGQKEDRPYTKVTSNLQNPWLHEDDIYYYTGSFFAKYNLSDGSIKRLSDYLYINSGISFVSWGKDSVVFQTNPQETDRDDVTTASQNLGAKRLLPHWWRYDFTSRQYQLLDFAGIDNCQTLVQLSSVLLGCIQEGGLGDYSSKVSLFDLSKKTSRKIVESDNTIQNLSLLGNSLFYTLTSLGGHQSVESVNVSSLDKKLIYSSKETIGSYVPLGSGGVLINEVASKKPDDSSHQHEDGAPKDLSQKLILIRGEKEVFDKKIGNYPVTMYANSKNQFLISSLDGSVNKLSGKNIAQIGKPTKKPLGFGDFLFKVNNVFFVIKSDGALLSSPPSHTNKARSPASFVLGKDNAQDGSSWIDVEEGGARGAYLFSNNISSSNQELAIGNHLEKSGFRPSEFRFEWVADGVDFHAPIRPKAIVIR